MENEKVCKRCEGIKDSDLKLGKDLISKLNKINNAFIGEEISIKLIITSNKKVIVAGLSVNEESVYDSGNEEEGLSLSNNNADPSITAKSTLLYKDDYLG